MPTVHLLRVFCSEDGSGGNPLAVFLDGSAVSAESRQGVAAELALSETVFVDDAERGQIRIFTPSVELDFAGHPSVGTAWLLAEQRTPVEALYLCGSSTGNGGGINGAPGYIAANTIADDLKLERPWKRIAAPEWRR